MFLPPRCPYVECVAHWAPHVRFFDLHGVYQPDCRPHPVPRFRCRSCRRTFSRQTFRADFRLKKPHLTAPLLERFVSHVSLRQCARTLGVARRTVEDRLDRFGRHALRVHEQLLRDLTLSGEHQFDELETYERNRLHCPLTVGVLVHRRSWFLLDEAVGTLRGRAGASARSKANRAVHEAKHGRRKSQSREVVTRCFRRLRSANTTRPVTLVTDEKPLYPAILREVCAAGGVEHVRVSGRLRRDTRNPLFPVNHMNAMLRYGLSRLGRATFCASKRMAKLERHLALHRLWWNGWRWKTNDSRETPAMAIGLLPRRLTWNELFGWRQEFGERSIALLTRG